MASPRRHSGIASCVMLITGWFAVAGPVLGQDKGPGVEFWKQKTGFETQAAIATFADGSDCALGSPLSVPLARRAYHGEHRFLQDGKWRFDFVDFVPPLPPGALKLIQDGRPLPDLRRKEFGVEVKGPDLGWYIAFNKAIEFTLKTPEDKFKNSALGNEHVQYPQLAKGAGMHRGKVLTLKGKLAVLRKEDAPRHVPKLDFVYSAWIITDVHGAPPHVITLAELPPDLEPGEKLNVQVTALGYFLCLVKFPADKNAGHRKDVICPLYVGKLIETGPIVKPKEGSGPISYYIIVVLVGGIVGVAFLVMVLNIWLRRGDAKVQAQLADVRDRHNPFTFEPGEEETPPKPAAPTTPAEQPPPP